MTHTLEKPSATSAGLMNASMLLYLFWLLLPAVQTTGGRYGRGCGGAVWRGCAIGWVMAQGARLAHAVARGLCPR